MGHLAQSEYITLSTCWVQNCLFNLMLSMPLEFVATLKSLQVTAITSTPFHTTIKCVAGGPRLNVEKVEHARMGGEGGLIEPDSQPQQGTAQGCTAAVSALACPLRPPLDHSEALTHALPSVW